MSGSGVLHLVDSVHCKIHAALYPMAGGALVELAWNHARDLIIHQYDTIS